MKKKSLLLILLTLVMVEVLSCKNNADPVNPVVEPVAETDEEFSGGKEGTISDDTFNAFGNSLPSLTSDEIDRFVIGNSFNRNAWVAAPSSTTARDGLGPLFNATACANCHSLDGKSNPFDTETKPSSALLFRLSVPGQGAHGEPVDDPNYGGQFNQRAINQAEFEGEVEVSFSEIKGAYPDGTAYSLRKPVYSFKNLNYGAMNGTLISPRTAPPMIGMGLFDAVTEQTILAHADPDDANNDGISGKPNYVWDVKNQKKVIGKLGWKANQPGSEQQTAAAFNGDLGITSNLFPKENLTEEQFRRYGSLPNGGNPEVEETILQNVVFYIRSLAVPARRNWKDKEILAGKQLFEKANCSGCHLPKMETGNYDSPKYVSKQVIRPYTDLLLHDMGDGLADNRPDFDANGKEWRTSPLWGLGLQVIVSKHTFMLHDGRARNVEEAILWHGGEAEQSKQAFMKYTKDERAGLLKFIDSL